jgi:hypothetical protein
MDNVNRVVACLVIIKTGTMHMAMAIRGKLVVVQVTQAVLCGAR